jgi:hypothetical protein
MLGSANGSRETKLTAQRDGLRATRVLHLAQVSEVYCLPLNVPHVQ